MVPVWAAVFAILLTYLHPQLFQHSKVPFLKHSSYVLVDSHRILRLSDTCVEAVGVFTTGQVHVTVLFYLPDAIGGQSECFCSNLEHDIMPVSVSLIVCITLIFDCRCFSSSNWSLVSLEALYWTLCILQNAPKMCETVLRCFTLVSMHPSVALLSTSTLTPRRSTLQVLIFLTSSTTPCLGLSLAMSLDD